MTPALARLAVIPRAPERGGSCGVSFRTCSTASSRPSAGTASGIRAPVATIMAVVTATNTRPDSAMACRTFDAALSASSARGCAGADSDRCTVAKATWFASLRACPSSRSMSPRTFDSCCSTSRRSLTDCERSTTESSRSSSFRFARRDASVSTYSSVTSRPDWASERIVPRARSARSAASSAAAGRRAAPCRLSRRRRSTARSLSSPRSPR